MNESVKIVSYNVHGLTNKKLFPEFFLYIKSYDIFLLHETHIMPDKYCDYEKIFGGFKLSSSSCYKIQ